MFLLKYVCMYYCEAVKWQTRVVFEYGLYLTNLKRDLSFFATLRDVTLQSWNKPCKFCWLSVILVFAEYRNGTQHIKTIIKYLLGEFFVVSVKRKHIQTSKIAITHLLHCINMHDPSENTLTLDQRTFVLIIYLGPSQAWSLCWSYYICM